MNMILILVIIVVIVIIVCSTDSKNEGFYFKSPPLAYDADACGRMCDNTQGCNSYYYDHVTRQCWMNSYYRYGDLFYPYVNNTYLRSPARYRWGRYWGEANRDSKLL